MSKQAQPTNGAASAAAKTPAINFDPTSKRGKQVRKEIISELCRGYHSRGPISECPFCRLGMEAKLQEIAAKLNRGNDGEKSSFTPVKIDGSDVEGTVEMVQEVTAVLRRGNDGGESNEVFWAANSNTLLKNTIDLYKLAAIEGKALVSRGQQ